jgi:hypothetical protein
MRCHDGWGRPYYPDCSTCGHNVSAVVAETCTAFVPYPEGDPRGLAGYCGCRCADDPAVTAWFALWARVRAAEIEAQAALDECEAWGVRDPSSEGSPSRRVRAAGKGTAMGLYDVVLGDGHQANRGRVMLGILGNPAVARFRDAWCEKGGDGEPVIAVYTRTGGGNRADYQEANGTLAAHPLYLRDADDTYDRRG